MFLSVNAAQHLFDTKKKSKNKKAKAFLFLILVLVLFLFFFCIVWLNRLDNPARM